MAAELFYLPFNPVFTSNGLPAAGATLTFYLSGTSTLSNTYTTSALTIPHPNPVPANGAGRLPDIYLDGAVTYRLVIKDSAGATIDDIDPYIPGTALKGDPGGNVESVGVFTEMSGITIAAGTDTVRTSGHYAAGDGGTAAYVYDATVDAAYVDANPKTSFRTANGRGFKLAENVVNIRMVGAKGDGTLGVDGPAIRLALTLGKPVYLPKPTDAWNVDSDPDAPVDGGFFSHCISVPSNAVIYTDGGMIRGPAGAQSWQKVVQISQKDNVRIFGELWIDGNAANRGATTNEHMHCLFLFAATNVYIERVRAENARGDNVYIGGGDDGASDNDALAFYSINVLIGSIRAKTAGRKNLVVANANYIRIGDAFLDNSVGGSAVGGPADTTEKHCFDIEPNAYDGDNYSNVYIGNLVTYGTGNDITTHTNPAIGRKYTITVDNFLHIQSSTDSTTVYSFEQNAGIFNCGRMTMIGLGGIASPILIKYGSEWNVGSARIIGASPTVNDYLMEFSVNSGYRPKIRIGDLYIENSIGPGIRFRNSDCSIGRLSGMCARFIFGMTGNGSSLSTPTSVHIGTLESIDTGTSYIAVVTATATDIPQLRIDHVIVRDSRATKPTRIFEIGSTAAAGIVVGSFDNPEAIPAFQFTGTDKFWRVAGGVGAPSQFFCTGTPEGMITAPVGSLASRTDGGASTTVYAKESGTGNTGWRAIPTYLSGSATYDPPSLATATQQSTTVTVTGAALGDKVDVSFSLALAGTRMWGEVTAADTVTVYHRNDTGAAVDIASGTLSATVTKTA